MASGLSLALVLVPLLGTWTVTPAAAQTQILFPPNGRSPNIIIQSLAYDLNAVSDFEFQVSNSLLAGLGILTETDKNHLYSWGRNNLRAALFLKLAELAQQDPATRTPQESSLLNTLTSQIKERRYSAAFFAREEYRRWQRDACAYTAPAGFTAYERPCQCYSLLCNAPAVPPSFELFQAYGAAIAHQNLLDDVRAQLLAHEAAKKLNPLYGLGAIAAGGGIGAGIARAGLTAPIIRVLFPFATRTFHGSSVVLTAARVASSAARVAGSAASFVAIITAVVVGVFAGIAIVEAEQLPGKLQEAIDRTNADRNQVNPDPFLKDLLATDAGRFEVWAEFLTATLPDYNPATSVPSPAASDPKFLLQPSNTQSPTLTYRDWEGKRHTARLSGGWFVDKEEDNAERLTLDIEYVNHQGEQWFASRRGPNFIHTRSAETPELKVVESAQIEYKDGDDASATAIITGAPALGGNINIAAFGVGALSVDAVKGTPTRRPIGIITPAAGDSLDGFTYTINGGPQTTVDGVTISDLMLESTGRITAQVAATCNAPFGDLLYDTRFSLAASKGGKTAGTYVPVQPTTSLSANPLPVNVPSGTVGASYTRPFEIPYVNAAFGGDGCSVNPIVSVASGQLPPGLSLTSSSPCGGLETRCNLVGEITGTPTSMGVFTFTLKLTFLNGETHTRTYRIFVNNGATEAPEGMIGWWPGEGDTTDASGSFDTTGRFNHARPADPAGNQKFARGWAGRGFQFEEGSHGGIFLPNTIFPAPPLTFEQDQFTFETWFKITPGTPGLGGDTHVVVVLIPSCLWLVGNFRRDFRSPVLRLAAA